MNIDELLKNCHTEKDAITLAQVMGYLSVAEQMVDKCSEELNNFTFQSKELENLNRLILEMKILLTDFEYERIKSILK